MYWNPAYPNNMNMAFFDTVENGSDDIIKLLLEDENNQATINVSKNGETEIVKSRKHNPKRVNLIDQYN